jgi:hypothetical protein
MVPNCKLNHKNRIFSGIHAKIVPRGFALAGLPRTLTHFTEENTTAWLAK